MHYTIYMITNLVTGNIYVGCHKTENLDDDYMGSGKLIKRAIEKHGVENFRKEYLHVFDNPDKMFEAEASIVNEEFVRQSSTYNMKIGGNGGWPSEQARRGGAVGSKKVVELRKNDPDYREWHSKKISDGVAKSTTTRFAGKTHTDQVKKRIGQAASKHQSGSGNSNFGKCWIHHLDLRESKTILKTEIESYVSAGWRKGRKIKF